MGETSIQQLLLESSSATHLFESYFQLKQEKRRYSLRNWASRLGYKNPSFLSDILKGRRRPNVVLVGRFSAINQLRLDECLYLYNLLFLEIHPEDPQLTQLWQGQLDQIRECWRTRQSVDGRDPGDPSCSSP